MAATEPFTLIADRQSDVVLEFPARPRIDRRYFPRWIWTSACGRYRVTAVRLACRAAITCRAELLTDTPTGNCWEIISEHRLLRRAFAACQAHAKRLSRRAGE